jgi:hypothetical protein
MKAINGGIGLFHEDAKPRDKSIPNLLQNRGRRLDDR